MKVDRTATPLTEEQVATVLRDAYALVFGHAIDAPTLACAWAQVCLEHARGKAIFCHNIGNVTTKGVDVDYYELTTDEQIRPGIWKRMGLKYRAHDDAIDGACAYWTLLHEHYSTALSRFRLGEPEVAAHALKDAGYFTADVAPYAASMRSLFNEFMRRHFAIVPPAPDPDEITPVIVDVPAVEAITDKSLRSLTAEEIGRAFRGHGRDDDDEPPGAA